MSNVSLIAVLGVPVLVVVVVAIFGIAIMGTEQQQVITIDEKWTKYHNNDAKYLVSDTDGNVYSIEDSVFFWKFDASNRYACIDDGETYQVTMVGWRKPFLSWYRNIIEIEEA